MITTKRGEIHQKGREYSKRIEGKTRQEGNGEKRRERKESGVSGGRQ